MPRSARSRPRTTGRWQAEPGPSIAGRAELAVVVAEDRQHRIGTRQDTRRRVDAERLRMAREVHDTVAHGLSLINIQAGVTVHVLDRPGPP